MATKLSFIFYGLLATIILYFTPSVRAALHYVPHDDSSIEYVGGICNEDCERVCRNQWWVSCALSDGSKSHRTKGGPTSANFSFKGSSITWYTRTTTNGARASVYIDDALAASVDTSAPTTNEANPIFTKSGLDPTSTHRISIVFNVADFTDDRLLEKFVDIHAFEYEDGVGTGTGGSSTTQSSPASPSGSSVSSGSTLSGTSSGSLSASGSSSASNRTSNPSSTAAPNAVAPVVVTFVNGTIQTVYNGDLAGGGSEAKTLSIVSIVGLVLGVAVALCIFAFCFFFMRRRRRQSAIPMTDVGDGRDRLYPPASASGSEAPSNSTSRYRFNAGQPFDSTDTFHNLRDSHFYTLRNPEARNVPPIVLYEGPDSKRRLAQLDCRNPPDDEYSFPSESHSPPLSSQPYQPSNVSGGDEVAGDRTDYAPASPGSATHMTVLSRESTGAHLYGLSQTPSEHPSRRSSGGTWLPNTPPPVYRR